MCVSHFLEPKKSKEIRIFISFSLSLSCFSHSVLFYPFPFLSFFQPFYLRSLSFKILVPLNCLLGAHVLIYQQSGLVSHLGTLPDTSYFYSGNCRDLSWGFFKLSPFCKLILLCHFSARCDHITLFVLMCKSLNRKRIEDQGKTTDVAGSFQKTSCCPYVT